jgi:protocatechuate 3,4-dioxygenase beta subunit
MKVSRFPASRRQFLQNMAFATAAFTVPGVYAEELSLTPRQTEGPFYPDKLPLDTDNDLLILNDKITPAVGQVVHLGGKILSASGEPVRNATVEIWEADVNGVYIHTGSPGRDMIDGNFQGFGRFLTGSSGEYYFRTIKPVRYGRRTPHIHMAVLKGGTRMLTTECYVKGEPRNLSDPVISRLGDPKLAELLMAEFKPVPGSKTKELSANFDIVIGTTPEEPLGRPGGRRPRR